MKEINAEEASRLRETHTLFWDTDIKGQSGKALYIRCQNKKGAWQCVWIPTSKVVYVLVPDLRTPGPDSLFKKQLNTEHKLREKYYIPKFFTK